MPLAVSKQYYYKITPQIMQSLKNIHSSKIDMLAKKPSQLEAKIALLGTVNYHLSLEAAGFWSLRQSGNKGQNISRVVLIPKRFRRYNNVPIAQKIIIIHQLSYRYTRAPLYLFLTLTFFNFNFLSKTIISRIRISSIGNENKYLELNGGFAKKNI